MSKKYDISVTGFADDFAATIEGIVQYLMQRVSEAPNPAAYEEILDVLDGLAEENDLSIIKLVHD